MKTRLLLICVLLVCMGETGFSQETSSKQTKEEQKIAVQQQTEALLNGKEFVFVATYAYPTGYRSVNLTGRQNTVKFHPDLIISDLPYFGRASSNAAYASTSDGGLKFEGKPEEYKFEKKKKNYQISTTVKESGEAYRITLTVQFTGSASLTITCNYRSPISFNGDITPPVTDTKNK